MLKSTQKAKERCLKVSKVDRKVQILDFDHKTIILMEVSIADFINCKPKPRNENDTH